MAQTDTAMDQVRSFMISRVILTAAELDFFTRLDEKPCTASELAREKGLDLRATTRVLDCLVGRGFLEKEDSVYKCTEKGSVCSARHPETIRPMVLHASYLWDIWSELTDVVKKGGNSGRQGIHLDDENWNSFIGAMHVSARKLAQKIASKYDASRCRRLLDIGGASGTYTIAFLQANPSMAAVLFDLENVIPMAKARLIEEKIADRVRLVAGDFYRDELPKGCDLALLFAVIHQNTPEKNLELYTKIYRALEPGGTLLIRDHIMDESRTTPAAGAVFAINMLVNRHGGDTYTFAEIKEGLEKAGFVAVKQLRHGESMDSLV
ncbi:MAG TPA: methyltransferase, partial [Candidatus Acidoferrales bacterium]|nr:methyltransferase [Candidatus Acidoferrales bacterium]